jgi:hypothetical protein
LGTGRQSKSLPQRHSIGDALTQFPVVPVLDALEDERPQHLMCCQSAAPARWLLLHWIDTWKPEDLGQVLDANKIKTGLNVVFLWHGKQVHELT